MSPPPSGCRRKRNAKGEPLTDGHALAASNGASGASGDGHHWDCSVCTYRNHAEAFKCAMCDVRKGTSTRKPRLNPDLVAAQHAQALTPPPVGPASTPAVASTASSSSTQPPDEDEEELLDEDRENDPDVSETSSSAATTPAKKKKAPKKAAPTTNSAKEQSSAAKPKEKKKYNSAK